MSALVPYKPFYFPQIGNILKWFILPGRLVNISWSAKPHPVPAALTWTQDFKGTLVKVESSSAFGRLALFSCLLSCTSTEAIKMQKCLTIPQAFPFCINFFVQLIPSCLSDLFPPQPQPHTVIPDKPQSSLYTASTLVPKIRQMSSQAVYRQQRQPHSLFKICPDVRKKHRKKLLSFK